VLSIEKLIKVPNSTQKPDVKKIRECFAVLTLRIKKDLKNKKYKKLMPSNKTLKNLEIAEITTYLYNK
jgi:hypothetical protein